MYIQPPLQRPRQPGHRSARTPLAVLHLVISGAALCAIAVILVVAGHGASKLVAAHRSSPIPEVISGRTGYCLDVRHDSTAAGATVESWGCNGTAAQQWAVAGTAITHNGHSCLSIAGNGTTAGDKVVANPCSSIAAGQVWVSAIGGFENPASALCLSLPNNQTGKQLVAASCDSLTLPSETWSTATWSKAEDKVGASVSCSAGTKGEQLACYAAKEWVTWRSGTVSHGALLATYTDGNPYEEWCADFVSYVYKLAGYPFAWGERDGWDEYLADNVQNMGFTAYPVGSYTPQPGDLAYFDYPGGHIEMVAVGGAKPIFIYGDSGTTDPSTSNGQMAENTITDYGSEGQLMYYLSPN